VREGEPWYDSGMATKTEQTEKDVIARLAGRGEEALSRLTELPGGARALKGLNDLRDRVEELSKRMRGVDALEQRVAKLEKELAALRRSQKPAATQTRSRKATRPTGPPERPGPHDGPSAG